MFVLTARGWACSCTWKTQEAQLLEAGHHWLWYQQITESRCGIKHQRISRGLAHRHICLLQQLKSCFCQTTEATRQCCLRSWHLKPFTWGRKTSVVLDDVFFCSPFPWCYRPSTSSEVHWAKYKLKGQFLVLLHLEKFLVSKKGWTPFPLQHSLNRTLWSHWLQTDQLRATPGPASGFQHPGN